MRKFMWAALVFACVVGTTQSVHADDEKEPAPAEKPRSLEFLHDNIIERPDGTIVYFYRTNFVTPAELAFSLTKLLAVPDVTFKEFPQQNVLLMEGQPDAIEVAMDAAAYFDVARPQVFIEMKILRITRASAAGTALREGGADGDAPVVPYDVLGSKARGLIVSEGTIEALAAEGKAELLSKPSLLATQGIEAEIQVMEERTALRIARADRKTETHQAVALVRKVRLRVKVIHVGDNFVTVQVAPEIQDLDQVSPLTPRSLDPTAVVQSLVTTVTLADGDSVVLASVYQLGSAEQDATPPLLLAPTLGTSLPRATRTEEKSEIVVILTPTIVRKPGALRMIAPPSSAD